MVRAITGADVVSKNTLPMVKAKMEIAPIKLPSNTMFFHFLEENKFPLLSVGFLSITLSSTGSTPKARAGNESVTRFTHNNWIASNGFVRCLGLSLPPLLW